MDAVDNWLTWQQEFAQFSRNNPLDKRTKSIRKQFKDLDKQEPMKFKDKEF